MPRAKTKARTTRKPRYEPVLKLPPLPPDQYEALKANIAVHGVLVPIIVDSDRPVRKIIDGSHRKRIADELGYECPEIVHHGDEEELRILARALNLARRQLDREQKRQLIADQIRETPDRTNRWLGKMLGVHHATVGSVRSEMESVGQIIQQGQRVGSDGKSYNGQSPKVKSVPRSVSQRKSRPNAVTLIHGDCRTKLKQIAARSVDVVLTDPIYPCIGREYGKISERQWHTLMHDVVEESRRVLKPKGSAVFVLQPNFEKIGRMRPWLWEFVAWAANEWNLIQDVWWWNTNAMPTRATYRSVGLLRQSMKMMVWLGPSDCYRNQEGVLWASSNETAVAKWSDRCLINSPSGHTVRRQRVAQVSEDRGGVSPFNLLPMPCADPTGHQGHPASLSDHLAAWWCRYILPPNGVLLDMFCGSGTTLEAALDCGAAKVIGIDKEKKYLAMAKERLAGEE